MGKSSILIYIKFNKRKNRLYLLKYEQDPGQKTLVLFDLRKKGD